MGPATAQCPQRQKHYYKPQAKGSRRNPSSPKMVTAVTGTGTSTHHRASRARGVKVRTHAPKQSHINCKVQPQVLTKDDLVTRKVDQMSRCADHRPWPCVHARPRLTAWKQAQPAERHKASALRCPLDISTQGVFSCTCMPSPVLPGRAYGTGHEQAAPHTDVCEPPGILISHACCLKLNTNMASFAAAAAAAATVPSTAAPLLHVQ